METYNYQTQFTVGGVIDEAWALTKKHFPVFLLLKSTISSKIISSKPAYQPRSSRISTHTWLGETVGIPPTVFGFDL